MTKTRIGAAIAMFGMALAFVAVKPQVAMADPAPAASGGDPAHDAVVAQLETIITNLKADRPNQWGGHIGKAEKSIREAIKEIHEADKEFAAKQKK